jgi:hypothetical protein
MSNLTSALIIVLCVSAVLVLGGIVATDIRGSDANFMSCQGTLFNNCTGIPNNIQGQLPSTNLNPVDPTGITGEEGIFSSIGSWLADTTGLSFIYNVVSAPSTFLKSIGLETRYADIIAGIWYSVALFLVISWWKGQDS